MDWGKVIMDSIVVAIIGLIAVVVSGIITDFKWYKKIAEKIGNHKSDTLEGQHERIKETIAEKVNNVEKNIVEKVNGIEKVQDRVFNKVDCIDKLLIQKETEHKFRLDSMNENQKEIKNHVQGISKFIDDWEKTIVENKELKSRIAELEKKNRELEEKYDRLLFRYRKDRPKEDIMEI